MKHFIEECRREWKRLGVPEAVADEMTAELAADLTEAAAEGASAEDVLGGSAFDPRSFAAAWAAERGFVGQSRRRRPSLGLAAAIAAFTVTGIAGAVLMIVGASSTSSELAVAAPAQPPTSPFAVVRVDAPTVYRIDRRSAVVTYDLPPLRRTPAPMAPGWLVTVETDDSAFDTRTLGLLLLTVGLAGLLPLLVFWLAVGAGRPVIAAR